ncbi:LytR/AlgR family response regulator transcription factor [Negadavirga shengliensis]|uniref:LytR/AlgR family response regulator transcription factor n=1 Tax=Negadavirga shengliensis TaxID=1389218 RepID=A0ABV9SZR9_9BACT
MTDDQLTLLIIEDERHAAERLRQMVSRLLPGALIFSHLESISSTLKWLKGHAAPDLIFCDIELADGQSFEIFENISIKSPLIFTTAYDQFAIRAFKLNSVDYLLKPIDAGELEHAILKFKNRLILPNYDHLQEVLRSLTAQYKRRFLVKFGEKIQSVPVEDIAFFFSAEKITFMQTRDKRKYVLDFTLDQLESMLDPKQFFRLNRQYIASFGSIAEIYAYSNSRLKIKLLGSGDNDILVSREKTGDLKEWLGQ